MRLAQPVLHINEHIREVSPLTTTFSASLVPLQPGSWLMSIFAGFGAVPSNFTVPLTVATVAGSIGVAGLRRSCRLCRRIA